MYFVLVPLSSGLFVLIRQTGFPDGSGGIESTGNARVPGSDPWVQKIPWRREWLPTQYSGLENSMDYIVHEIANSRTRLSNFLINTHMHTAKWRDVMKKGSIANLNHLGLRGKVSQTSALHLSDYL